MWSHDDSEQQLIILKLNFWFEDVQEEWDWAVKVSDLSDGANDFEHNNFFDVGFGGLLSAGRALSPYESKSLSDQTEFLVRAEVKSLLL